MQPSASYDHEFNSDPEVSPYGWADALIPAGSRVLDLGCGNGVLLAHLAAAKGCAVQGADVEAHPALRIPRSALQVIDLERDPRELADLVQSFEPDVVLLLDVLEHLVDPERILSTLAECAGAEARVLVSLPNVANASILLRLLSNRFPYQESGLLDATHLRFFTSRSAERAFERAGFLVEGRHSTRLSLAHQEWRAPLAESDQASLARLAEQLNAQSTAYQVCFALRVGEDRPAVEPESIDSRLSVVVRFHDPARLGLLDQALFSLSIQEHEDLEVLVAVQNPTPELLASVQELVGGQPWRSAVACRVLEVEVPRGRDGRSRMLNRGVQAASGRYLAFLDDDDLVYHDGYTVLIEELRRSGRVLAFGGCRMARLAAGRDHAFVRSKTRPFARQRPGGGLPGRIELFADTFTPINTLVIDRSRLGDFALEFDESLPCLEDYDLLLRLCACFAPSFARIETPVSEYRVREDGSNTVLVEWGGTTTPESQAMWDAARATIEERRRGLVCLLNVGELVEQQRRVQAQAEELAQRYSLLVAQVQAVRDGYSYRAAQLVTRTLLRAPRLKAFARRLADLASGSKASAPPNPDG